MRIAVIGSTGLVGTEMLKVLANSNIETTELIPIASEKSVGKEVSFMNSKYKVVGMEDGINKKPQIALFSAGGETSKKWAPKFAEIIPAHGVWIRTLNLLFQKLTRNNLLATILLLPTQTAAQYKWFWFWRRFTKCTASAELLFQHTKQ